MRCGNTGSAVTSSKMPEILDRSAAEVKSVRSASDISEQSYRYFLAFLLLAAAVLRFWHLGERGLWYDEGFSWGVANLPWGEFFHNLTTRAADMSLYYLLLKLWKNLGDSEFAMRALSAVFSVATVPVIGALGRELYSRKVGVLATAFFSVHVFVIRYAQENRSYALVGLLAALGWLQLVRAVREPSAKNWLLFSLISIASVYAHFIAGLNIVAQVATLLFLRRDQVPWRLVLRSAGVFVIGIVPALLYTFENQRVLVWIKPVTTASFLVFLDDIAGEPNKRIQVALFGVMFAILVWILLSKIYRDGRSGEAWAYSIPVVGFAFPVLLLVLVSLRQPVFVPRYLLFSVVPLLLGVAQCCARLRPVPGVILSVILLLLLLRPLPRFYAEQSTQDFRGAIGHIRLHEQPGDALMVWEPMGRATVDYYGRDDVNFPKRIFPVGERFQALDVGALPNPYALPQTIDGYKHIWIVYTFETTARGSGLIPALYLQRMTERTHKLVSMQQFRGVRVEEYSK